MAPPLFAVGFTVAAIAGLVFSQRSTDSHRSSAEGVRISAGAVWKGEYWRLPASTFAYDKTATFAHALHDIVGGLFFVGYAEALVSSWIQLAAMFLVRPRVGCIFFFFFCRDRLIWSSLLL